MKDETIDTIVAIIVAIVLMVIEPLFAILALNTLFKLTIEYSFINWLAVLILIAVLRPNNINKNKN